MMKKIKKIVLAIGIWGITLINKVFAIVKGSTDPTPYYGPPSSKDIETPKDNTVLDIFRLFVIPLVLLIGIIVYFKKSKSSNRRKIITTLIFLIIIIILYLGINYTIVNML